MCSVAWTAVKGLYCFALKTISLTTQQLSIYTSQQHTKTTKVADPSRYGVVVPHPSASATIARFVEKPTHYISDQINAGVYLLSPRILRRVDAHIDQQCAGDATRAVSLEREIFPRMVEEGALTMCPMGGEERATWYDLGTLADLIRGTAQYLREFVGVESWVGENVVVGEGCRIGGGSVVERDCVIGD